MLFLFTILIEQVLPFSQNQSYLCVEGKFSSVLPDAWKKGRRWLRCNLQVRLLMAQQTTCSSATTLAATASPRHEMTICMCIGHPYASYNTCLVPHCFSLMSI